MKDFLQKQGVHFLAIAAFFIIVWVYFSPQFNGYGLKQHDIQMFKGMSHEITDYRERTGEETLWTNAMFGGMPSIQISVLYEGNYIGHAVSAFIQLFPPPAGVVLLYMLGFYILAMCLRMNPWIGIFGAIAFAFSTYDIIILQAGHNSKALAIAFMAPVLGAFIMTFQRSLKWGLILSAIFMTIEISMNHLQVTYYLAILLFGLGVVFFITMLKNKELKKFLLACGGLIGTYILAVAINYGNISLTADYAKHTIRGGNDVTINPDGTSNSVNSTSGLDKDYVTQWSYGIGESFTLISPYVKGGGSVPFADSPFADQIEDLDLSSEQKNALMNYYVYWGDQPLTSGPVYVGVIVALLALLALIFVKNPIKWALLGVTILTLALSWGKNYMGLTNFFLDNVPGYNKFRAVTIILIMVELCLPVLAMLFLHYLVKERENLVQEKKKFIYASLGFFVFLVGLKFVGIDENYMSENDKRQFEQIEAAKDNIRNGIKAQILSMPPEEQQKYGVDVTNAAQVDQFVNAQYENYVAQNNLGQLSIDEQAIKTARSAVFDSSMNRSILFTILGLGLLALFFFTQIPSLYLILGLTVFIAADLFSVSANYLNSKEEGNGYKHWQEKSTAHFPVSATGADYQILEFETNASTILKSKVIEGEKEGQRKATEMEASGASKTRIVDAYKFAALNRSSNYRVFDVRGNFSSADASYFHKSLGGYHGAKLRNIQNLFEYHISKSNNKVFDMLNVKYFIQEDEKRGLVANQNPFALGNAWFVKEIKVKQNPNEEIASLGNSFEVQNVGQGQLLVNKNKVEKKTTYGSEELKYVLQNDTLDVRLSNGMSKGMEAYFVMDINGKTNLVPKQTLDLDTSKSFLKLVEIKVLDEFTPSEHAVMLKEFAAKLSKKSFNGAGSIKMNAYAPNRISYESNSDSEQFAVFSEIYYPEGWTATIDGKEVPIFKTNYLLRGIQIPKGKHKIEFSFSLTKYEKSGTYAMLGNLFIFVLLGFAFYTDYKNKSKNDVVSEA